jgi:hypothetical protein
MRVITFISSALLSASVVLSFSASFYAQGKTSYPRDSVKVSQGEASSTDTQQPSQPPASVAPISPPTLTPPAPPVTAAPKPVKIEKKPDDKFTAEIKRECERHFPGLIQAEVRAACSSSATDFIGLGKNLVETRCRLNYGEEPRLVMACLIGASVTSELSVSHDAFRKKLQLCSEYYPVHNEIDAFLQESCLTGVHLPDIMNVTGLQRFEACAQITPERSFIGPCAVGLSLSQDTAILTTSGAPSSSGSAKESSATPSQLNKLCGQYFNLHQFHKGYRACLNARSLVPDLAMKPAEAVKTVIADCSNILSEANSDTERAACFVGLNIYRHLAKQEDIVKRFQKCGDNQVTYQDRDVLACLTAASLLDFTDKGGAERGCKDVFKEAKSKSRGECLSSLALF